MTATPALGSAARSMLPPGPIITLVYRIPPERRAALFTFLREAIPFYERHGGTRVGLYESADDPFETARPRRKRAVRPRLSTITELSRVVDAGRR